VNHVAVVEAVVEAACKRRILDREPGRRLAHFALEHGATSLESLRAWLGGPGQISADLAKRLAGILAPQDMEPFGAYHAFAHLADGGMGRVWLGAKDKGPLIVIKTMKRVGSADARSDADRLKRFEREARITQSLAHPNVVRCLDSGAQPDGTLYLILEYVESGDLRDLVDARKSLPEPLSLGIIHQIVDALAVADMLHLIHRDIKPSNIFVAHDGKALLADFGIARSTSVERTSLTIAGALVGSPQYMSPEQVRNDRPLDIRSDLYSLGAVLYYCLAGRPPFDGNVQDVLHLHCHVAPPDVRALKPAVSAPTASLINRCLGKDPDFRPQTPTAMREMVEQALAGMGITLRQAFEEDSRRYPTVVSGGHVRDDRGEQTIIADLSGKADNTTLSIEIGTLSDPATATAIRSLTATLLATDRAKPAAEVRSEPGTGSGTDVEDASPSGERAPSLEALDGDPAMALTTDWVTLVPDSASDPTLVMLFARSRLVLGKLKDPPIDVCLRNYPVAQHKEVLNRISRQHVELSYDRLHQQCMADDLGGTNGTLLDGSPLIKGQPRALTGKNAHVLVAATAVSLWLRCRKTREADRRIAIAGLPPSPDASCGLEIDHAHDSVIITRPENRPELAYAMVLRRVSVGGPGSDLAIPGARSLATVIIGRYAGRWLWKTAASDAWKPLVEGQELDCGGRKLTARPGHHDQF
jgi:serine/threonine protein kinase